MKSRFVVTPAGRVQKYYPGYFKWKNNNGYATYSNCCALLKECERHSKFRVYFKVFCRKVSFKFYIRLKIYFSYKIQITFQVYENSFNFFKIMFLFFQLG